MNESADYSDTDGCFCLFLEPCFRAAGVCLACFLIICSPSSLEGVYFYSLPVLHVHIVVCVTVTVTFTVCSTFNTSVVLSWSFQCFMHFAAHFEAVHYSGWPFPNLPPSLPEQLLLCLSCLFLLYMDCFYFYCLVWFCFIQQLVVLHSSVHAQFSWE